MDETVIFGIVALQCAFVRCAAHHDDLLYGKLKVVVIVLCHNCLLYTSILPFFLSTAGDQGRMHQRLLRDDRSDGYSDHDVFI